MGQVNRGHGGRGVHIARGGWAETRHRGRALPAPGQHAARENTRQGEGISWFDEDKWTLGKRVEQILTGVHYAEEPLSRTAHLVTNIRVISATPSFAAAETAEVSSRFLIQQNRVEYETTQFVGRRRDILRREAAGWRIARREIILEQNVLLAKNLSIFF